MAYNVRAAQGRLAMIAKEILEILVCPVCKKPVIPSAAQDSLKCPQCRRVYPVRDDIPIMLVDEARVDEP
ncbi:MAG TPA: Trm112 family protein [Terriglobales bacterium]|nr:Trm112 family protein [Terriglobales bacterium]